MRNTLVFLILFFSTPAICSDEFYWLMDDGTKAPNKENQKSISGFGAWLLVTPDKNWEQKWDTPFENAPYFVEAKNVTLGEELTILPFFANPELDKTSKFEILCDIKVEKPDGTFSINEKNMTCAEGKLEQNAKSIFLTDTVIKYIGEKGDPFGVWTVYFVMKDSVRGVSVPLKTSFNLVEN